MIVRDVLNKPLNSETWKNFDWHNDCHDTRRWVEKHHPELNELKAWLADGWMRYSDECLRLKTKHSKLKIKTSSHGLVESMLLNDEELIEKYEITSATYSMLPGELPILSLQIFCAEVEHEGPLDVEVE